MLCPYEEAQVAGGGACKQEEKQIPRCARDAKKGAKAPAYLTGAGVNSTGTWGTRRTGCQAISPDSDSLTIL
jgi:hypothetical protein